MRRSTLLSIIVTLTAAGCGPDARQDAAPSSSVAELRAELSAKQAEAERLSRELKERAGGDPRAAEPDAEPTGSPLAPSDANLAVLLSGGAALSALPVRSHDPGQSFDPHLPDRLKPPPVSSPKRCDPRDPLCDE